MSLGSPVLNRLFTCRRSFHSPLVSIFSWCCACCCCCWSAHSHLFSLLAILFSLLPSSSLLDYQGGLSSIAFCFVFSFLDSIRPFRFADRHHSRSLFSRPSDAPNARPNVVGCWRCTTFIYHGCQIAALGGVVNSAHLEFFLVYSILLAGHDFAALAKSENLLKDARI